jgi:hypothetical protein
VLNAHVVSRSLDGPALFYFMSDAKKKPKVTPMFDKDHGRRPERRNPKIITGVRFFAARFPGEFKVMEIGWPESKLAFHHLEKLSREKAEHVASVLNRFHDSLSPEEAKYEIRKFIEQMRDEYFAKNYSAKKISPNHGNAGKPIAAAAVRLRASKPNSKLRVVCLEVEGDDASVRATLGEIQNLLAAASFREAATE